MTKKKDIPVSSYTVPFDEITKESLDVVGGKNAHLGEVINRINVPIPDGFAVTAFAYIRFMEHNSLLEKVHKMLSELQIDNMEQLNKVSKEIQDMVSESELPEDLHDDIKKAVETLKLKAGDKLRVSVRSSALHEDGDFSFAGQYSTFLNVLLEVVPQKYKEL